MTIAETYIDSRQAAIEVNLKNLSFNESSGLIFGTAQLNS